MGKRPFRHEAFFYAGEDEFLAGIVPFVQDGVEAGEAMLVALDGAKIRAIKGSLNGEAESVHFTDMEALGQNPARIIPAWHDFVAGRGAGNRPIRGVGEPIWPGRSPAELAECHQHESLLNLAFAQTQAFWLLCPYDTSALAAGVVEEAQRTHPLIAEDDLSRESAAYVSPEDGPGPFAGVLPAPAMQPSELAFCRHELGDVRRFVSDHAHAAGLTPGRTADLVLAASELATNSVLHGGGDGTVATWREGDVLLCEVRDGGRLDQPLVGRERPSADQASGRGLWLVNHLCDLVQLRTLSSGNVVRLHMRLP